MPRLAYKHYMLGVLSLLAFLSFLDRNALGIMFQDIKGDLNLSDTQLGFLSGISFAFFYAVMGIPIARWADRGDRVLIISLTAILWSVFVALCGLATSFLQLLLLRVAVAIGEAGCVPPAYSLMADYFTRSERPRATAIYGLSGLLSLIVAYILGAWLNEKYGWRIAFFCLGIPGLLLGALAWLTLKEPRRTEGLRTKPVTQPPFKDVCVLLWANRTFRHLLLCISILFFFSYGIMQWQPAFFIRSFGLGTEELGVWLAMSIGLGGLFGAYMGGEWAVRFAAHDESLQLKAMAVAIGVSGVAGTLVYVCSGPYIAFGLTALSAVGGSSINGPLIATMQTLVPVRMRAVAIALVFLVANLIGMGFGPLVVGALSDAFRPWTGEDSLRYALILMGPGLLLCAWQAWRASETVARDLESARTEQRQEAQDESSAEQPA